MNAAAAWVVTAGQHGLWQLVVIALLLSVALGMMRHAPPVWRARVVVLALLAMLLAPPASALVGLPLPWAPAAGGSGAGWALVWGLGVGVGLAREAGGAWLARAWAAGPSLPPALAARLGRLAARVGRPGVRFVRADAVAVPSVVGWWRPVVLVPASAITGLRADELEAVVLHELAHVLRHDALANLAVRLLERVWFFHPAAAWVGELARAEREYAADALAAELHGDARPLARGLLRLAELGAAPEPALGSTGGVLAARVARLLHPARPISTVRPRAAGLAAVFALALLVGAPAVGPGEGPTAVAWAAESLREPSPPQAEAKGESVVWTAGRAVVRLSGWFLGAR